MKKSNKLRLWFNKINIYWLFLTPLLLALFLLAGLLHIGEKLYDQNIPESYMSISLILFLLVSSLSGFAQIIRREGPGPFGNIIYGFWPVISGVLLVIISWGALLF